MDASPLFPSASSSLFHPPFFPTVYLYHWSEFCSRFPLPLMPFDQGFPSLLSGRFPDSVRIFLLPCLLVSAPPPYPVLGFVSDLYTFLATFFPRVRLSSDPRRTISSSPPRWSSFFFARFACFPVIKVAPVPLRPSLVVLLGAVNSGNPSLTGLVMYGAQVLFFE